MMQIHVHGVPIDLGGNRRGVDVGPSGMRITNLIPRLQRLGHTVVDKGDLDVPLPEECDIGSPDLKYGAAIRDVCIDLSERVSSSLEEQAIPVVLGGDHSVAMGSVTGVSSYYRSKSQSIGLLWVDAHGDMNIPESSGSGNVHGMPLAHILGLGKDLLNHIMSSSVVVEPAKTVIIGARNIDAQERELIHQTGVNVFTMMDIDRRGLATVMDEALSLVMNGTNGFHVSFDIDALDPLYAPGVGTPVRGGISLRESHLMMELVADTQKMTSLDMVEVNPIVDMNNITAEAASELILSAFGKTIL